MNVTDGDLSPHFTLFRGLFSTVHSQSFDVDAGRLEKQYEVDSSGTYFFAVRAFQNQGAGKYSFAVECTGGPCNGEFTPELIDADQADACLKEARDCAFERMGAFNGAVGPARARSLLEGCLADHATDEGVSCSVACDAQVSEDAPLVCDSIIAELPFWADQSEACIAELDDCMEVCLDIGDFGSDFADEGEMFGLPFSQCWEFGFNGTCPSYARELTQCGGGLDVDSNEACHELCESTDGAWGDDLDTICSESC